MGAKNHAIVMPDANKEATIDQLIGASMGAAGRYSIIMDHFVIVFMY